MKNSLPFYHCGFTVALMLLTGCGKKAEEYTLKEEPITESVYASGIVKSRNQYQVYPKVNGIVEEVYVEEGDLVKKGQAILRIGNTSSRLSAQTAKLAAQLASANARGEKLKELEANIEYSKARMKNDSLLWIRQQNLWSQQIGTRVELEQKELAYRNSVTAYSTAVLRYEDSRKQLQFLAEQARNNSEISSTQEDDFVIRSESDGRVFILFREKGEMASAMNPIAIIGDAEHYYMELQVDEYDITRLEVNQKIYIGLDSYKGQVFEGRVSRVNKLMDERSRSFKVEAEFTKAPPKLFPNLSLEANIVIASKDRALTVPRNYLISDSFVLNRKQEKVRILTGLKDYKRAEILSGLHAGDVIVKPSR
ncbi:MAG TPA: efflux RND transporter periplasmic adaptor subunit [Bacteroidia bacterium]|nr:efflux RND transporter periplasmic adaptor subunit [Bacteroidia bacterium]